MLAYEEEVPIILRTAEPVRTVEERRHGGVLDTERGVFGYGWEKPKETQ